MCIYTKSINFQYEDTKNYVALSSHDPIAKIILNYKIFEMYTFHNNPSER